MYCIKCGKEIPNGSRFCPECGNDLNSSVTKPEEEEKIKCPKCRSTQLTSNKKGFSAGKAIGGAILTGGVGLLAGLHGAGNITLTCLKCGAKFKPGVVKTNNKIATEPLPVLTEEQRKKQQKDTFQGCLILVIITVVIFIIIRSCSN